MKRLVRKGLAVSVALAVMATAAMSYADTKNDEEDDSVFEWGPWGTVQTAAGPGNQQAPLIISFANGRNTTDSSGFVPGVENPDDGSEFREYMAWYSRENHEDGRKFERAFFESLEAGADGPEGRPSIDFTVATEAGEQTYSPDMVLVGNSGLKGAGYSAEAASSWGSQYWIFFSRYKNRYTDNENFEYSSVFNQLNEDRDITEGDIAYLAGQWSDETEVDQYKKRHGRWRYNTSWDRLNDVGFFVSGNTSTLASINQLLAGNVEATYRGSFMTTHQSAGNVNLVIDFGSNSWSGDFVTPTSSLGHNIEFSVNDGAISGVDLSGSVDHDNQYNSKFFRYEQSVTGQVDASFFGNNAQHVNGIADVDADTDKIGRISGHNYGTTNDNYVGVFTTELELQDLQD